MKDNYTKEEVFQLLEEQKELCSLVYKNRISPICTEFAEQTIEMIKNTPLATGESNYVVIEKEKFLDIVSTAASFAITSGIDRQELEKTFFEKFGMDFKNNNHDSRNTI